MWINELYPMEKKSKLDFVSKKCGTECPRLSNSSSSSSRGIKYVPSPLPIDYLTCG